MIVIVGGLAKNKELTDFQNKLKPSQHKQISLSKYLELMQYVGNKHSESPRDDECSTLRSKFLSEPGPKCSTSSKEGFPKLKADTKVVNYLQFLEQLRNERETKGDYEDA